MRKWLVVAAFIFMGRAQAADVALPADMAVKVPVADVRAKPKAASGKYKFDELQETQVELGERVRVLEKKGKWFRVECMDQEEFTHNNKWQGYPGWIEAAALTPDLTFLKTPERLALPLEEIRAKILEAAASHIGNRYLWGGRSLHNPGVKKSATGVDCSGLINWSFRQVGWIVPRDAHEQFMRARSVRPFRLQPADVIFLAKTENPHKIVHVMFYAGNGEIIEAPQSGERVRRMTFQERFGKPLEQFMGGETVGDRIVYFGTLFGE